MDTDIRVLRDFDIRMLTAPSPHSSRNSLSVKVVEAVATYEGVEMTALPPLAEVINPDALNELFDSIDNKNDTETHLSLAYSDHTVRIYPDQTITID